MPELADLPPTERAALWRKAQKDPLRVSDGLWLLFFLCIPVGIGLLLCLVPAGPRWLSFSLTILIWGGMTYLMEPLLIARYRPVVRRLRNNE